MEEKAWQGLFCPCMNPSPQLSPPEWKPQGYRSRGPKEKGPGPGPALGEKQGDVHKEQEKEAKGKVDTTGGGT